MQRKSSHHQKQIQQQWMRQISERYTILKSKLSHEVEYIIIYMKTITCERYHYACGTEETFLQDYLEIMKFTIRFIISRKS